jgi:hypothetical protein
MRNPVTACLELAERALNDAVPVLTDTGPFAPLFTRGTEPTALLGADELGRPLSGIYVPDSDLL